mmetsp:Transcript_26708/g.74995  ORF Transcript_26708/g.74995 Transcript_26708/m.74995 type:complete len:101 (-) Transcript_26708:310-612(-)
MLRRHIAGAGHWRPVVSAVACFATRRAALLSRFAGLEVAQDEAFKRFAFAFVVEEAPEVPSALTLEPCRGLEAHGPHGWALAPRVSVLWSVWSRPMASLG